MAGLGKREWVGLGLLLVAAFISATFLDAGAHDNIPPRTPVLGQPLPSPSIEPTATATLPPPTEVEIPDGSWLIEYFENDNELPQVREVVVALDLYFANAPFGDFGDDDWKLEARTDLRLAAGQQTFTLLHDGAIRVLVNGNEVASDADPADGPRTLTVIFPFDGGLATIRIVGTDVDGPFELRWQ
jgi:hypothetical protein